MTEHGRLFHAAFSATAFHWVAPEGSWSETARVLRPGGLPALIWYRSTHFATLVTARAAGSRS